MGDLNIPHVLTNADSALKFLIPIVEQLSDDKKRKAIESDIKNFHALNDSESKKHDEAKSLIKKHSDVLDETRSIAESNKKEKETLAKERIAFSDEMAKEREKLAAEKLEVQKYANEAAALYAEAIKIQDVANVKEEGLVKQKEEHYAAVKKLLQDTEDLEAQRAELDKYRESILDLDRTTKEKLEGLKKYNF